MQTDNTAFSEGLPADAINAKRGDSPRSDAVNGTFEEATSLPQAPRPAPSLMKRLGLAGFVFFTVKGMLWLVVGYVAMMANGCTSWGS